MKDGIKLVRFDWFVKFMLRDKSNFEILEGFLSELLKEDIRIIEILESESNKQTKEDKFNRVDILVRDAKDDRIIVEIQNNKEYDYLQRILYGSAKALAEHLHAGSPYADVRKIISVSVVYFEAAQGIDYIYHGKTVFTGMHQRDVLRLTDEQQELYGKQFPQDLYPEYYLIKAEAFDERIKDTLDEWIYFFKNGQIKQGFTAKGLAKAKKKLDIARLTPAQRRKYERYAESLHSIASYNHTLQKDLADARKAGLEEGKAEGKAEGIAEGKAEGIAEGKYEVAANLLRSGAEEAFIAKITGLSEADIQTVRRRMADGDFG